MATDGTGTLIICTPQYDDGYELESATVEGDTLSIGVSHSGGCANHEWELCWDGEVMESAPVQIRLPLGHNANGDSCEAIETDNIQSDISVLADVETSQLLPAVPPSSTENRKQPTPQHHNYYSCCSIWNM